jgi:hypothetical protein
LSLFVANFVEWVMACSSIPNLSFNTKNTLLACAWYDIAPMLIIYNFYMKVRVWEIYILLLLMNIMLLRCTCKAYGNKEQHGSHIIVSLLLGFFWRWIIANLWTFFKIKSCVALFVIISQLHSKCWPCTPNVEKVLLLTIYLME